MGATLIAVERVSPHAASPLDAGVALRKSGVESYGGASEPGNLERPSWFPSVSRLAPPVLKRRAALFWTVDFTAAELTDEKSVAESVLMSAHNDHLHSLTESQDSGDPRLQSC